MAQSGNFTPILLYSSSTSGNIPVAGNLLNNTNGSETAINIADGRLFYKDPSNNVQKIADKTWVGTVTSVAALTLGTTGTDLSSTVANGTSTPVITLNVPTASSTNRGALSSSDWSTFNGKQAALVSGTNIKTVGGVSLLGSGDVGTIGVAYGGTGLTSLTAGYIPYGNGTSAFNSSSSLYFSGSTLGVGTSTVFSNSKMTVGNNTGSPVSWGIVTLENSGGITPPSSVGLNIGWNFSNGGGENNIVFGTTAGSLPRLAISSYNGTSVVERMSVFASGGVSIGNTTDPGATNLSVTGNGLFGTTTSVARLTVKSSGTTSATNSLALQNSAGTYNLIVQDDGNIYAANIGTTTGTALVLSSTGYIQKLTSSIRYKKDVEPIDIGLNFILGLNPVKYNLINGNIPQVGFIAEDFPDSRLTSSSLIDNNDSTKGYQVESVTYAQIVAPLVKAIQEQQIIIEQLKAKVGL